MQPYDPGSKCCGSLFWLLLVHCGCNRCHWCKMAAWYIQLSLRFLWWRVIHVYEQSVVSTANACQWIMFFLLLPLSWPKFASTLAFCNQECPYKLLTMQHVTACTVPTMDWRTQFVLLKQAYFFLFIEAYLSNINVLNVCYINSFNMPFCIGWMYSIGTLFRWL